MTASGQQALLGSFSFLMYESLKKMRLVSAWCPPLYQLVYIIFFTTATSWVTKCSWTPNKIYTTLHTQVPTRPTTHTHTCTHTLTDKLQYTTLQSCTTHTHYYYCTFFEVQAFELRQYHHKTHIFLLDRGLDCLYNFSNLTHKFYTQYRYQYSFHCDLNHD